MTTKHLYEYLAFTLVKLLCCLFIISLQSQTVAAQDKSFFAPADSLDQIRFYSALGIGISSFTATSVGLYNSWYRQFEQTSLHSFNDWQEWQKMDKLGHAYTAYNLSNIGYQGARWTGVSKKSALLIAGIGSTVIQSTIEVMDGFSAKWGFSYGDMAFNLIGTGAFIAQQSYWDEQRIRFKISSSMKTYPLIYASDNNGNTKAIEERANELYGEGRLERFLKDYNGQTLWVSANIHSFFPSSKFPKWLNIALGYSAENMLGGFENSWEMDDNIFQIEDDIYPRYHQFILSLDADLNRIKTKSYFLNTLLKFANIFKVPAPSIEYNSLGEWRFYLVYRS